MSSLQFPAIDDALLKGVGHLQRTSLPVGGDDTRTVLTAHRGLANATMFTNLDQVKVGDTFTLTTFDEVLTYKATDTRVIEPEDTASLRQEAGRDLVTLVTCTPLGITTHRILVTGERVMPTPEKDIVAATGPPVVPFPWWIAYFLGALVVVGLYVWWEAASRRKARRRTNPLTVTPDSATD